MLRCMRSSCVASHYIVREAFPLAVTKEIRRGPHLARCHHGHGAVSGARLPRLLVKGLG